MLLIFRRQQLLTTEVVQEFLGESADIRRMITSFSRSLD